MFRRLTWAACAALALPAPAPAQPPGGAFGPGFGPTNRLGDVQKQLGASDEEWKVIGPKLQKVISARQTLAADLRGPDANPGFPGGFFGFNPFAAGPGAAPAAAPPGQILAPAVQDQLKLSPDQRKQLADLQKELDGRLDQLLTAEQRRQLAAMRAGPGAAPAPPPGGPGFPAFFGPPASGGAVARTRADLKAVLDDPKHTKADADEKIEAVRKALQKDRADLEAAQKDLTQLLTPEQQAVLISLGYLD